MWDFVSYEVKEGLIQLKLFQNETDAGQTQASYSAAYLSDARPSPKRSIICHITSSRFSASFS